MIDSWDELKTRHTEFYIKHNDSRGDQCFWEPDGTLAAWIDWEWLVALLSASCEAELTQDQGHCYSQGRSLCGTSRIRRNKDEP